MRAAFIDSAVVEVGFNPTMYNASEDAGVVTLTIERMGAAAQPVTVTVFTTDPTADGIGTLQR